MAQWMWSLVALAITASQSVEANAGGTADYSEVEPILRSRCYSCHGPERQRSGLRLDRRDDAIAGGDSGPVIIPGNSAESRLIRLVSGQEEDLVMPPKGTRLGEADVSVLRRWIDAGAPWAAVGAEAHWSFQPLRPPALPEVRGEDWIRSPVDRFIRARLEAEGIEPAPEAERRTLVRRLFLDLIGIPPAPSQVQEFLEDESPQAYERLVDRLLASPHYGEKWARFWLDQARYADSDGFEVDHERPFAWRYRQWVIEALNKDQPFDQFTIEQIAGDLLPDATVAQKIATGFHRNAPLSREAGVKPEHARFEQIIDRTNTVGQVWLGMTLGCARCHDHKFDPISQREYYQMFAFFNTTENADIGLPAQTELGSPDPQDETASIESAKQALLDLHRVPNRMKRWERQLLAAMQDPGKNDVWDMHLERLELFVDRGRDILQLRPRQRSRLESAVLLNFYLRESLHIVGAEQYEELKYFEILEQLDKLGAAYPQLAAAHVLRQDPRRTTTHVHYRGDFFDPGEVVQPGTPAALPPLAKDAAVNRLGLARWITASDNPLTARVFVNRQWQELFGRGLAANSDDFGSRGGSPSHPGLLDWLATEFREGWSMKALHRTIVSSAAYRQSSRIRADLQQRDPDNTLVARQGRRRLAAELVRDSVLSVSGLLHTAVGGPSVKPPQPRGFAEFSEGGVERWKTSPSPDKFRRGLYIHLQRTAPYPQLTTFDAPDSTVSCTLRETSNTPLQALNLLNDPVFVEAAQSLAARVLRDGPTTTEGRIGFAFECCLGRLPTEPELQRLLQYYTEQEQLLDPASAAKLAKAVVGFGAPQGEPLEAATWACVARLLLNLDEFLHRE